MVTRYGDSADAIKQHIKRIVATYKALHPEDYKLTREAVRMKRQLLQDEKFATSEGSDMRALYEISETLSRYLISDLNNEEATWFKTTDGARWFARTFGEFTIPDFI